MSKHDPENVNESGNLYILTPGLPEVPETLVLAPGVALCSIGNPLTIFDLAAAGAVGFHGWSVLEPVAPFCKCEIESTFDSTVTQGYDTMHRAWLASAMRVLRGFTAHLCVASSQYSWREIAGYHHRHSSVFRKQLREEGVKAATYHPRENLRSFQGQLLDFHLEILSDGKTQPLQVTQDDATWVNAHFDHFNVMAAESESFRFALTAAIDWRYAHDPRSAVARLWSGIEAIFGISSELVYRVSLLSSSLTRPRGSERKTRFDEVKKLYGMRSKIVHGEKLPDEIVFSVMAMSYELLRELLLLAIERGHMLGEEDFDEAVFY